MSPTSTTRSDIQTQSVQLSVQDITYFRPNLPTTMQQHIFRVRGRSQGNIHTISYMQLQCILLNTSRIVKMHRVLLFLQITIASSQQTSLPLLAIAYFFLMLFDWICAVWEAQLLDLIGVLLSLPPTLYLPSPPPLFPHWHPSSPLHWSPSSFSPP